MTTYQECGKDIGERLVLEDGQLVTVRHYCGKPARLEGPDGELRCVQHDRMARGLSGKWSTPEPGARETTP